MLIYILVTIISLLNSCNSRALLSHFCCVQLLVILRTVAHQTSWSMGFSRQECWSGLPCPPPGNLPDPGIKPKSLTSPALAGGFFTPSASWEALGTVADSNKNTQVSLKGNGGPEECEHINPNLPGCISPSDVLKIKQNTALRCQSQVIACRGPPKK